MSNNILSVHGDRSLAGTQQRQSRAQPCRLPGESGGEIVTSAERYLSSVALHVAASTLLISPLWKQTSVAQETEPSSAESIGLVFIDTSFENASPLHYEVDNQGQINVHLVYDHERSSPNRAAGHWHFRVQAKKGSQQTIISNNLLNVWNGKQSSIAKVGRRFTCHISTDGQNWQANALDVLPDLRVKLDVTMEGNSLYVARTEPYRVSDLDKMLTTIATVTSKRSRHKRITMQGFVTSFEF